MKIKKEALEKELQIMLNKVRNADDWFDEQKITIHCEEGLEVQIIVTNDEDNFIGEVYQPYDKAN